MTKRTFFKSIMGAVAAVALAPEIAFGVRLKMPEVTENQLCRQVLWWWCADGANGEWLTTGEYTGRWREATDDVRNRHRYHILKQDDP